jgi:hypothetical protein
MPQTDKAMALQVPWFLLASVVVIFQLLVPVLAAAANSSIAPSPMATQGPGCPTKCGNVQIPYPFGLSDECSWKGQFTITCNHSFSPPRPFAGNLEVIDISLEKGEVRVFSPVAYVCYNSSNTTTENGVVGWTLNFTGGPGLISSTRNEFVAIGCCTVALIEGKEDGSFFTGCISTCVSLHDAAEDGAECTGLGCCQTHIPPNLSMVEFGWNNGDNNLAWRYSPCSYAFVAQKGWYVDPALYVSNCHVFLPSFYGIFTYTEPFLETPHFLGRSTSIKIHH